MLRLFHENQLHNFRPFAARLVRITFLLRKARVQLLSPLELFQLGGKLPYGRDDDEMEALLGVIGIQDIWGKNDRNKGYSRKK